MDFLSGLWGAKGAILDVAGVIGLGGIGGGLAVLASPPAVGDKIGLLLGMLMKVFLGQRLDKAKYYASTAEGFIEGVRKGMK